nr:hypothetical protein Itr_chr08CG14720 [Ipomoea trifida]
MEAGAREAATSDQGGASSFSDGVPSVLMAAYQRDSSGKCFHPSNEDRTTPSSLFFPASTTLCSSLPT